MALVVEPRIAHSLTSRPVRGALQVDAMEPTSTQTLRLIRSIHFQLAARETTTALSRTSARVRGYIWQIVDGEAGHLGFGKRAPHAVGVHHRPVEHGRRHEGLDGVAAADLERHHGAERPAEVLLHHGDGEGHRLRVGEALLADEGSAHVGDDGHPVVVGQLGGIHELAHHPLPVELAHVQEREVGAAAAPGAENPGADGEALDLLDGDRSHQSPVDSSSRDSRTRTRWPTAQRPSSSAATRATSRFATRVGAPVRAAISSRVLRRKPMQSMTTRPAFAARSAWAARRTAAGSCSS